MIYFFEGSSVYLKIGWTRDGQTLAIRCRTLNYACPFEVRILCTFPGSLDLEQEFHHEFKGTRVHIRGEWYNLSFEPKARKWFEQRTQTENQRRLARSNRASLALPLTYPSDLTWAQENSDVRRRKTT